MKSPASYGLGWAKSSLATKGCSRGTLWRLFRPNAQRESIAPVDRTALAEAPSTSVHRELSLIGHHQLRNEHSHNWISRLHVDHSGIGRDSRLARAILVILVHRGALLRCSMRAIYSNHRTQPRQGLSDFPWDARRDEADQLRVRVGPVNVPGMDISRCSDFSR